MLGISRPHPVFTFFNSQTKPSPEFKFYLSTSINHTGNISSSTREERVRCFLYRARGWMIHAYLTSRLGFTVGLFENNWIHFLDQTMARRPRILNVFVYIGFKCVKSSISSSCEWLIVEIGSQEGNMLPNEYSQVAISWLSHRLYKRSSSRRKRRRRETMV